MTTLTPLLEAWDEGHREFAIALNGLPDEDLWRRPHPRLLSVGELAGHVVYWEAVQVLGGGDNHPDLASLPIQSPLIDPAFRYYSDAVEHPFAAGMGVARIREEMARIHEATKAAVAGFGKEDACPGNWRTWGNLIQYQAFHVAYHTGQTYSARHLMGHETEDN